MVTHEFLPRIVGPVTANAVYKEVPNKAPVITINYYKPTNRDNNAFIPIEISVAVYRLGHSMARPRYTVRDVVDAAGAEMATLAKSMYLWHCRQHHATTALNGGRRIPANLKIHWKKFFEITKRWLAARDGTYQANHCRTESNAPYRRETVRPINHFASVSDRRYQQESPTNLAIRNLMRGQKFRLPSGQAVARAMGLKALTNVQLAGMLQWYLLLPRRRVSRRS